MPRTAAQARGLCEVDDSQAGRLSVGYVSEQLTGDDLEGVPSDELLTDDRGHVLDEHGRPLDFVYGVVAHESLVAPLHPDDLAAAREQAIASYSRFLRDEDGHRVAASTPFELRTAAHGGAEGGGGAGEGTTAGGGGGATAGASRGASGGDGASGSGTISGDAPPDGPGPAGAGIARARGQPATRRRMLGGAAALGAAVIAGALLVGQPSAPGRDRAVDPGWLDERPADTTRMCVTASPAAAQRRAVRDYNNRGTRGAKAELVTLPATRRTAGAASASLGRGSRCDVVAVDVSALAQLASEHLLYDMTPYLRGGGRQAAFDPSMVRTARYDGRLWGVPAHLDAAVLYYRADRVRAPRSWPDVYRQARQRGSDELLGMRAPAAEDERLTVVFLELAYAAGARQIISADGKTANIDQQQARSALALMRQGIRDGVTPSADPGEEGAATRYERGQASFLRGSASLAGRLLGDATGVGDAPAGTAVAPLPPWRAGGRSVSILTGSALVIPRSAGSPAGALQLVDFLTSVAQVRRDARDASSVLPVRRDVARAPGAGLRAVTAAIGRTRLLTRPQLPRYAEISAIISAGIRAALRHPADRATLELVDRAVQRVLDRDDP